MALRIHFPWQLLITVLGFGALGAAAAYFLAGDFDGQLYHQCAAQAAGAGLLGACGWFLSERLSYAANLNMSPFLRLTAPGLAAVLVSAVVVGPFTEFTVGSGALWADLAGIGLYVAAGVLPMVAGVSLLAFAEALLAARRGNAELATALRPILPHFAMGLLLAGVVVYSAIELHGKIQDLVLALVPERPRASGWLERQKALFTQVLSGAQCEVLVVPFETEETRATRPMRSLDRPARSLITRQVAAGIAVRAGLCVSDPTLVARALGPRARSYDWSQIARLADTTGARWVVRGAVKLDSAQRAYELAIRVFVREPGEKPRWSQGEAAEWGPVPFSDELPPEAAFEPLAAGVVEHLGWPVQSPAQPASLSPPTKLPPALGELADDPASPLARARRLQLVAASYPPSDVNGEHLWERSVIAAAQLPDRDEEARMVRARAALHLYRRPYALALLRGLDRPEARALVALAQGNLFDAEALVPRMTDPAAALITDLELELMRARYARSAGFGERRRALLDEYPGYASLLYVPLSGDDWLQPAPHEIVWRQLTSLGVAIPEDVPVALLRTIPAQFSQQMWFFRDIVRLPVSIERSYAPLWRLRAPQWRATRAFDRLAQWDLYDALYAANRAAVVASAKSVSSQRVRPEAVLAFTGALGQVFAGDPALEEGNAWALGQLRYERKTAADPMLDERQRRLLRDLVAWAGGETETERFLAWALPRDMQRAYLDEPPRDWRAPPQSAREPNRADLESNVAQELRALSFSQYDFAHL
ncbi:MAG TPA: hypothetical protein VMH26_11580, partial [Burkholderiales bacterium]|nr:hypothetical protein [Burkholderiales bacterium]